MLGLVGMVGMLGCDAGGEPAARLRGQSVEVLAVWTEAEQVGFERVLRAFEEATGASVTYTPAPSGVPEALGERAAAGDLPDVALLPQPGLIAGYADRGWIVPVPDDVASLAAKSYAAAWQRLAEHRGESYGVWFKAADKSVVWYNVALFEAAGVVPPADVDGLVRLAGVFAERGMPAFSVGAGDGWTLTDWFENLYLRSAGPERYVALARHEIPWTDPTVRHALELMRSILAPEHLDGGPAAALELSFEASVGRVFAAPPQAAMVFEGDFVAGALPEGVALGVDADVFPFPAVEESSPARTALVGGGDIAVLTRRSPAADAFVRFLTTPDAAIPWASLGGFLSPNHNLDLAVYPDETTRSMARAVIEADEAFRFDLSDLQPGAFGSSSTEGLRPLLQRFLVDGDVDRTATDLEAAAAAAFG